MCIYVFFSFFLKSEFCKIFKYSRSQMTMPDKPSEAQLNKILDKLYKDNFLLNKGFKCNKILILIGRRNASNIDMHKLCINITKYYILSAFR